MRTKLHLKITCNVKLKTDPMSPRRCGDRASCHSLGRSQHRVPLFASPAALFVRCPPFVTGFFSLVWRPNLILHCSLFEDSSCLLVFRRCHVCLLCACFFFRTFLDDLSSLLTRKPQFLNKLNRLPFNVFQYLFQLDCQKAYCWVAIDSKKVFFAFFPFFLCRKLLTVEPWYNEHGYNEMRDITN